MEGPLYFSDQILGCSGPPFPPCLNPHEQHQQDSAASFWTDALNCGVSRGVPNGDDDGDVSMRAAWTHCPQSPARAAAPPKLGPS